MLERARRSFTEDLFTAVLGTAGDSPALRLVTFRLLMARMGSNPQQVQCALALSGKVGLGRECTSGPNGQIGHCPRSFKLKRLLYSALTSNFPNSDFSRSTKWHEVASVPSHHHRNLDEIQCRLAVTRGNLQG